MNCVDSIGVSAPRFKYLKMKGCDMHCHAFLSSGILRLGGAARVFSIQVGGCQEQFDLWRARSQALFQPSRALIFSQYQMPSSPTRCDVAVGKVKSLLSL